ncbi:helix-turn-helix domain-containing protein [Exiguobacterium sp. s193]|uniref:helix-turn-helix domain-containing protein n=1 Tax=Exiguobacterium sp. s193 TaxID=2751207 RepID=UPI001BE68F89|nr:helix-turn-helix domain-containing protein [Exiguobacterium sp. s193]
MEVNLKPLIIKKYWFLEGDRQPVNSGIIIVVVGKVFLYDDRQRLQPGESAWVDQTQEVLAATKESSLVYHLSVTGDRCPLYRQDPEQLHAQLRRMSTSPTTVKGMLRQQRLVYELLETLSHEQEKHEFEQVTKEWLEQLGDKRPVNELALELGMSVPTFNRLFKERYAETPKAYLNQLRIRTAKEWMLTAPDMTLAQISQKVGLQDEFYFSRLFKKRTGSSPTHFLKRVSPRIGIASRLLLQDHLLALGLQPILAPSYPTEYGASGLPVFLTDLEGTQFYDANRPAPREVFESMQLDLIIKTPDLDKQHDVSWSPTEHVLELSRQTCWSEYLRLLAIATNREERLEPIMKEVDRLEQTVRERVAWHRTGTWAVIWIRPDEVRLYGTGQHTMLDFLFHDLGMTSATGLPETVYQAVTLSELKTIEPDNLLILWSQQTDIERVQHDAVWQTLKAVSTHRVYCPDSVDWDPWGPLGRIHMLRQFLTYIEQDKRLICP